MEDDWICRHRYSCNTYPEQDIRAGWVLTSKPCVKFSPCMTHHGSVEVWPTVPRIFFSKESMDKMQHKKLLWSVCSWGESSGQQRTGEQAVCTSAPADDHNLFLPSAKFLPAFVICVLYLLSYNPLRAEQLIGNECCTMLMTRNVSSDTGQHLLGENCVNYHLDWHFCHKR